MDFARLAVGAGRPLQGLDRTASIAMEISANEAAEQPEFAELERGWRDEEPIAALADGELAPVGLLESLRLRITGQGTAIERA